jgi:hypothetical protein
MEDEPTAAALYEYCRKKATFSSFSEKTAETGKTSQGAGDFCSKIAGNCL